MMFARFTTRFATTAAVVVVGATALAGCADEVAEGQNQTDNNSNYEGADTCCLPPDADFSDPEAPEDLTATSGDFADRVELEWSEVEDAQGYAVYRDDERIDDVDDTEYADYEAEAGGVPGAPEQFEATDGDHSLEVHLSWDEPEVEDGPAHSYEVAALADSWAGDHSEPDEGYRAGAEIERYELEIGGGDWTDVGEQTDYTDTEPPRPQMDVEEIDATTGDHIEYVFLEYSAVTHSPGETRSYRVRAVNETGDGEPSETAEGYAELDEDDLQWQRSLGEQEENFGYIDGATDQTHEDYDAPSDASLRWYRVAVGEDHDKAAGILASEAVPGFRLAPVDWFERDELLYYEGDVGQASIVDDPVKEGDGALETDGNNEEIVSVEGDGLEEYPGLGDEFYVWVNSDFAESRFEGPHIYWGPGTGYDDKPAFQTRIRDRSGSDYRTYLSGPGDCRTEKSTEGMMDDDSWYRLEIRTSEGAAVDKEVYDTDDELVYSMDLDCDIADVPDDVDTDGIGFRAGGFGTTWYDHWTMTQLDYE